ncbi:hypothetical protein SHIRM173S_09417 [Streptomyces hirsutus]
MGPGEAARASGAGGRARRGRGSGGWWVRQLSSCFGHLAEGRPPSLPPTSPLRSLPVRLPAARACQPHPGPASAAGKKGTGDHGERTGDLRGDGVLPVRRWAVGLDRDQCPPASPRGPRCSQVASVTVASLVSLASFVAGVWCFTWLEQHGRTGDSGEREVALRIGAGRVWTVRRQERCKSGYRSSGRCALFPFDTGAGCTVTLRSVTNRECRPDPGTTAREAPASIRREERSCPRPARPRRAAADSSSSSRLPRRRRSRAISALATSSRRASGIFATFPTAPRRCPRSTPVKSAVSVWTSNTTSSRSMWSTPTSGPRSRSSRTC